MTKRQALLVVLAGVGLVTSSLLTSSLLTSSLLTSSLLGLEGARLWAAAPGATPTATDKSAPISVRTATVAKKDVVVMVEGLGTVTSLATVTVKTLVDGRLERIAFRDGAEVVKGELLAIVDPRPFQIQIEQGQAALERDSANHVNSHVTLQRYEGLRLKNLIPQQQVDDQRSTVKQLSAAMLADRAQIETGKLNYEYAHIRSPVTGVVGIRLVDQGNIVHTGDPNGIVVVTQLDPISVIFTLPQDLLPRLQKALAAGHPHVEAWSRSGADHLGDGELQSLDNLVNVQTATIRLRAIMPNPYPKRALWPNQFVKARLHIDTLAGATVVPTTAVQRGAEGAFVYVVEGSVANMRPVQVGAVEGEETVIAKGVSPGEVVVTDGQNLLRPGAKVAPRT
jgi:multidrug efflux system membrane fusion protein